MNSIRVPLGDRSYLDTILTLPSRVGALALAAACRDVALEFMHAAPHWGKAELAMWLMGPYARITQYACITSRRSGELTRVPLLREIDARMVDRVILSAHAEVTERLASAARYDGEPTFALDAAARGFVVRCEDERGRHGWAPSTEARRLADRVLSLFAADFLARPAEFETEISVCGTCRTVDFDGFARLRGVCHRHGSGFFYPQERRVTLPYLPEGA